MGSPKYRVRTLAFSALLLCSASCTSDKQPTPAAAPGPPDLSGVWQIAQPLSALQTETHEAPPLTAAAQTIYQQRLMASRAGDSSWDDTAKCKPPGEPRTLFEMGWPFQIGQSPERVVFMFQWNRYVRVIEMGLNLPDFDGPFFYGRSSGSWEGDTLVAHVVGVREEVALDGSGLPHTDDMKMIERFRLINEGRQLEARIHFEDPATFTQPWDTVLLFNRLPETAIIEDHCLDRLHLPNSYRPTLEAGGGAEPRSTPRR
ncbi:MAG: hypothetical protein ABSE43_10300 [Steroidobacteraceae bacterium]|jgi:hypothetical protein